MAKEKKWKEPIPYTSNIDWGTGDASTNNLPLAGSVVQQYIKENLQHKAGYFHSDETQGICFAFASRDDFDAWDGEDNDSPLIIGKFGITQNFQATLDVDFTDKSVALGDTGNIVGFTWQILDKSTSIPTGEDAYCNLSIYNRSTTTTKTTTFPISASNSHVEQNIDQYLLEGANTVTITVTGATHKVSMSRMVNYNVINLSLSDSFDIAKIYDSTLAGSNAITINYALTGLGAATTEWWWDGLKLSDSANYIQGGRTEFDRQIYLPSLSDENSNVSISSGVHTIQFRSYSISNGETFYTDTIYKEVIINNSSDELTKPCFAIQTVIPKSEFDPTADVKLYGMTQYVPFDFTLAAYYPGTDTSLATTVELEGLDITYTEEIAKGRTSTIEITPNISGTSKVIISASGSTREIDVDININKLDIHELGESNGLVLNFSADGRTNTSANRNDWSYGSSTATFTGFDWTVTSGWNGNKLNIKKDSSLTLNNYYPFATDPGITGKTIEFEYTTYNVLDENTIIGGIRNTDNTLGIILTGSEAKISTVSQTITVKYKSDEAVRISFVIERRGSSSRPLLLVYMNGVLSGGAPWNPVDTLEVNSPISFIGSDKASVALKQIRVYDTALTSDQILNNYMLYRDTFSEMQSIYNRNDILEDGTISVDAVAKYMPVMIVTGNIPWLDSRSVGDKGTIALMPKIRYIDYIHNKSFTFINGGMSCQGTSSMLYPKKNYRLYTQENKLVTAKRISDDGRTAVDANWKMEDSHFYQMDISDLKNEAAWREIPWTGKANKHKVLYSFRDNGDYESGEPQAVSRWCIKADFMESSSTHNTGIARLWNKALYDAVANNKYPRVWEASNHNQYPLRTNAQRIALENDYPYDVRTCIDGFPIAMFYQITENDPLTFMGKYNFNNDKSTESVFGFCDIPGFDDEYGDTMQCWELTNSGNPASLFIGTDISEKEIEDLGFEARYPDDAGEATEKTRWNTYVKPFYDWMVGIRSECVKTYKNPNTEVETVYTDTENTDSDARIISWVNPERFSTEKYEYMDVPKMAAYYVYIMRFGAVDQVVKNAMFTSEDGRHWYYINYDNDTVLGLDNLGMLKFGPYITRNTYLNADYAYAARESTLWNCLENDEDFMAVVKEVDDMLRLSLSYANVIKTFDTDGSSVWCERIYNQDALNKYINTYRNDGAANYLYAMQGTRRTHRRWWVSNRFDYFDTVYENKNYLGAGDGVDSFILNFENPPAGKNNIAIVAGADRRYGTYADEIISNSTWLNEGQSATFEIEANIQKGRNVTLLQGYNIRSLDVSIMTRYVNKVILQGAYNSVLGSKLKTLILGRTTSEPNENAEVTISGFASAKYLEELYICNYRYLTSVDELDTLQYLKTFNASGSGLTAVSFAKGAPLEYVTLPASINTLKLEELPLLKTIAFDSYEALNSLTIKNCDGLRNSWELVKRFRNLKNIDLEVNWGENDPIKWNDLCNFLEGKTGTITGVIALNPIDLPSDIIEQLFTGRYSHWFGDGCLNESNQLYIKLPKKVYLRLSKPAIIEGDNMSDERFWTEVTAYPIGFNEDPVITFGKSVEDDDKLNVRGNIISANEVFNRDTVLNVYAYYTGGPAYIPLTIINRVYPNTHNSHIIGSEALYCGDNFEFTVNYDETVTGFPQNLHWDVTGIGSQFITINNSTSETCSIVLGDAPTEVFESIYNLTLNLHVDNPYSESDVILTKAIRISPSEGEIISESSNPKLWQALKNGLIPSYTASINNGTRKVITVDDAVRCNVLNFSALTWGTDGVETFNEFKYFTSVQDNTWFEGNTFIKEIILPSHLYAIPSRMFYGCTNLQTIDTDTNIGIEIGSYAFTNCESLVNVLFAPTIASIGNYAFQNCSSLVTLETSDVLKSIGMYAFNLCSVLANITLTDSVEEIKDNAFYSCRGLQEIYLPNNPAYTRIAPNTFGFCNNLRSIVIPRYVTSIGNNAFQQTTRLASIDLNRIETIGNSAFAACAATSIELPSTLTSIGSTALYGPYLEKFTGTCAYNPNIDGSETTYLVTPGTTTLFAVANAIESFVIPDNITRIGHGAFWNSNIITVVMSDSVTEIVDHAFYNANKLDSVTLSPNVTVLPDDCFNYCSRIRHISVPDSNGELTINDLSHIVTLGVRALCQCKLLESVYFRDLQLVANEAFSTCDSLGEIVINNSVVPIIPTTANPFGTSASTYTGKSAAVKVLRVPSESHYEDDPKWAVLLDENYCNFTLDKTL